MPTVRGRLRGFAFVRALARGDGAAIARREQTQDCNQHPNTKIQGGADVRGSGANAGAGARPDNEIESRPRVEERQNSARPDKDDPKEDRPISERKPREREPQEGAAKGETARPQ